MNLEIDLSEQLHEYNQHSPLRNSSKQEEIPANFPPLLAKISSEPYDPSCFSSLYADYNPILDDKAVSLITNDDPAMVEVVFSIEKAARSRLKGFNPKLVEKFQFKLPPTVFTDISKEINVMKNPEVSKENIHTSDLSWAQRCEIFRTGKFTVKSMKFKQDYVWKMSTWIIQGRENIGIHFREDMEKAKRMLKGWWHAFYREHVNTTLDANIYHGVKHFWYFVRNLISILIGYPKIYPVDRDPTSHFYCDYMLRLLDNPNIDRDFWTYMFLKKQDPNLSDRTSENYLHLKSLEQKFENEWKREKRLEEKKLPDDENLKVRLQEVYYLRMEEYIRKNNGLINKENLDKLFEFHKCLRIIHSLKSKFGRQFQAELEMGSKLIRQTFLGHLNCYYNRKYSEYQLEKRKEIDKLCKDAILHEFKDYHQPHSIFRKFLEFVEFYEENRLAAEFLLRKWEPFRRFHMTVQLFPSSWTVEEEIDYQGNRRFKLIRTEEIEYTTEHWFWRVIIMLVRYGVWVLNTMYWLFVIAIASPLGIKALCGIKPFHPDKECDPITGEIREAQNPEIDTVISTFGNVLKSIRDDRTHFESQPDTGFFGKKFTRLCNLFYNYIFKLIFVGVGLVLVCYPILIVMNFVVSLFFALTSFLWMPIVLVFFKLFQLFIYDADNENRSENTFKWFPLISEFLMTLGVLGVGQIFFAVSLLVIKPILFVLIVVFGILRYVLRSIYDLFMMLFVIFLGRVPASDSAIAWKISGPVVSRKYYDRLDIFDAAKLYLANLERIELNQYQQEVNANMNKNQKEIEKFYENLNKPFGIHCNVMANLQDLETNYNVKKNVANLYTMRTSLDRLSKKLETAISNRKKILPESVGLYNVRFTGNELGVLEACCLEILKTFLDRRGIQDHWKNRDLTELGVLKSINHEKMKETINNDVLEAFEELDQRIELMDARPEFGTIKDVLHGKKGNANESLEARIVKERIEKEGIKYITPETTVSVSGLGDLAHSTELTNGIKVDVNLGERDLIKAEELRKMKDSFARINRKLGRKF